MGPRTIQEAREMLITAGNRRIHYDLQGPASGAVVCMAHCLSADSGVWSEQVPALVAQGFQVLRLDMRGHGGSDGVPGDWTMSDLADDVALVLDRLELPKVHLVGLSIGGMLAQTFALEHGRRLLSLMLTGTSPQAVPGGLPMWEARFSAIAAAGSLEPIADDTMRRWFTEGFRPRRPDRWAQIRGTVASTPPGAYKAGAQAIIDFDVLDRLPAVRTPTLVVCGDDDPGTPAEGNRRIAAQIPGARYEEIASARHLPMMEHPETFNRILLGWLAAQG
jgi:3-oxoadipate enol-lactonase